MDIFETWLVNKYIADGGILNNNFENTLPAYENAVKEDYAILLDVQVLSDGTIICYKDSVLKTNGDKQGYVSNLTSIDTRDITLKDGNKIPTFEEALETREFEPDNPNFTPRISGIVNFENSDFFAKTP